jgi:hypothetical protein
MECAIEGYIMPCHLLGVEIDCEMSAVEGSIRYKPFL